MEKLSLLEEREIRINPILFDRDIGNKRSKAVVWGKRRKQPVINGAVDGGASIQNSQAQSSEHQQIRKDHVKYQDIPGEQVEELNLKAASDFDSSSLLEQVEPTSTKCSTTEPAESTQGPTVDLLPSESEEPFEIESATIETLDPASFEDYFTSKKYQPITSKFVEAFDKKMQECGNSQWCDETFAPDN